MLTPRPYQIVGRDFLAARRFALLADEMRVGKTPQAILAADAIGARHVLTVCPAIAVPQWQAEWERWGKGVKHPVVVSYDKARRVRAELLARHYDVAIIDEAHFAKNPEALRTQMIYGRDGVGWHSDRLWALSGTPAPKHAGELWPMLRAFGIVTTSYDEFCNAYCTANPFTGRITGYKADMIPELRQRLAPIMLRRMRKDVAPEMPEISYDWLRIDIPDIPDIALPSMNDDQLGDWLEANPRVNKEDRQEVALEKADVLIDEVEFVIKNGLLRQTVIFGWHIAPLVRINSALNERRVRTSLLTGQTRPHERVAVQHNFREGISQVVCAQILAAGTAIDLSAARHGYFLELDWIPANNTQAANRLVSLDRPEPVTIDVVTAPGTTDDRIQRILLPRARKFGIMFG